MHRPFPSIYLFAIAGLCALVSVAAAPLVEIRAELVPLPQNDPFYVPQSDFATQPNGAVLRSRKIVYANFGVLPVPVDAFQLLFRSQAIDGSAIATVTTVFKPAVGAKLDRFVNFATAEDSSAAQCAPSYNYRLGVNQTNTIVAIESLSIQTYLAQGYIVNSPDYEGPDSAFTAGRLSGRGVLDSMRAVRNFASTLGLTSSSPAIAAIGYSGGAIATGWAASLHDFYAPELNVKAWAAGGVPANLTAVVENIDGGFWAGYQPTAIAGLGMPSAYATQVQPLIAEIATQKGKDALQYVSTHCQEDDLSYFSYQSILSPDFQTLGDRFLYDSRVAAILDQQLLGVNASERPSVPTMVYHSTHDEIIPYNQTVALVDRWCAQGSTIHFLTLANGGHVSGEIVALAQVNNFIKSAFDGTLQNDGQCTRQTELADTLNPIALGVSLEPLLFKVLDYLHAAQLYDAQGGGT
jgi:pimeloyl-ACP methyl ester carboxylesterase